jgi:hypothetical protein
MEKLNQYLDNLEIQIGLPKEVSNDTINRATALMNVDFSDFKYTSEECAINALILTTYAQNLQRVINKEKSLFLWCSKRIDKIITPLLRQQKAYNYEERRLCAIADDDIASRLFELKSGAEIRLTRMESIYYTVKNLAEEFKNLSFKIKDN